MVFLRSDGPLTEPAILSLYVANADGSEPRPVTPPTKSLDWFDWSPDGQQIAYMASGQLWVVDVDHQGAGPSGRWGTRTLPDLAATRWQGDRLPGRIA